VTLAPPSRIGPRDVFRNRYIVLRHDTNRKLVIVTRTSEPYAGTEALADTFVQMDQSIAYLSRPRTMLLIDSRRAPPRNDPAFEVEFARLRKHFLRDFQKIATIVQTAVGILQVSRQGRVDDTAIGVFTDPSEALSYLGLFTDPGFIEVDLSD